MNDHPATCTPRELLADAVRLLEHLDAQITDDSPPRLLQARQDVAGTAIALSGLPPIFEAYPPFIRAEIERTQTPEELDAADAESIAARAAIWRNYASMTSNAEHRAMLAGALAVYEWLDARRAARNT